MLRSVLLLALAALTVIGGGLDVWAAESDPAAVEVPMTGDPDVPAETASSEDAEEEALHVDGTGAPSPHALAARSVAHSLASRTGVPLVPPPR